MNTQKKRRLAAARHDRVRQNVQGTPERPRMSVKFTGKNIYVQFVDDVASRTLVSVGSRDKGVSLEKPGANVTNATLIGKLAATKAKAAGISQVVFDRGSARYHGKVKALADAARVEGLKL